MFWNSQRRSFTSEIPTFFHTRTLKSYFRRNGERDGGGTSDEVPRVRVARRGQVVGGRVHEAAPVQHRRPRRHDSRRADDVPVAGEENPVSY